MRIKSTITITADKFDTNEEIYHELYDLINDTNLHILNLIIFYDRSFENVFDFNLTLSNGLNLGFELSRDIYTSINFEISMQLISSDTNNNVYKLSVNASILMVFKVLSSKYYEIDRDIINADCEVGTGINEQLNDFFGDNNFEESVISLFLDTNDASGSSSRRRTRNLNLEDRRQLASATYYVKGDSSAKR